MISGDENLYTSGDKRSGGDMMAELPGEKVRM